MTARAHESLEAWTLAPVAKALGHPTVTDPHVLALIAVHDRETRDANIAAANTYIEILKTQTIPALEGKIAELTIDRNAWSDRANALEKRSTALLGWLLVGAIAVGAGLVILIGATIQ